jgi:hypothetical protein
MSEAERSARAMARQAALLMMQQQQQLQHDSYGGAEYAIPHLGETVDYDAVGATAENDGSWEQPGAVPQEQHNLNSDAAPPTADYPVLAYGDL